MMPTSTRGVRASLEAGIVPVVLSAATIGLGLVGWSKIDYDGSAHSALIVLFKALGGSHSGFASAVEHNFWTDLASIGGLLSVYSWFVILFWGYLRNLCGRLIVRLLYRDHVVVIGDTQFSGRAAKVWRSFGRRPLQLVAPDDDGAADRAHGRYVVKLDDGLVATFALPRVGHLLIDLGDDVRTLTLGFHLLSAVARHPPWVRPTGRADWTVVITNVVLADHFAEKVVELQAGVKSALPDIHYVDPHRLAVRHFMAAHPLFRQAEQARQEGVHVLIVGFAEIGRHLAEISILTARAGELAKPFVTVLTASPNAAQRRFLSGRPSLPDAVDIVFLPIKALEDLPSAKTPAAVALGQREAQAPPTIAFLVAEAPAENLRIALLIDDIHRKTGRLGCPLYSFEDNAEEAAFLNVRSGKMHGIISGFEAFGLPDEALGANLCQPESRDALARALHDRYAADAQQRSIATWYALPESLRRANRNAADHWRAIAHTLGFDVDSVPAGKLGRIGAADAARLLAPRLDAADADLIDKAARGEHERWMSERSLDGWVRAQTRSDRSKAHPLLVQWDTLRTQFPADVEKNIANVRAIVQYLAEHGDRRYPLPVRRMAPGPSGPA